jgi:hypothetical protein
MQSRSDPKTTAAKKAKLQKLAHDELEKLEQSRLKVESVALLFNIMFLSNAYVEHAFSSERRRWTTRRRSCDWRTSPVLAAFRI